MRFPPAARGWQLVVQETSRSASPTLPKKQRFIQRSVGVWYVPFVCFLLLNTIFQVNGVEWSPDGKTLIAISDRSVLRILNNDAHVTLYETKKRVRQTMFVAFLYSFSLIDCGIRLQSARYICRQ